MNLNILLLYDSHINTFINNIQIPSNIQINVNIYVIYNSDDNSIIKYTNDKYNINYYNLSNVNDIFKIINADNILYITNNNLIICSSFYYSLLNYQLNNNTYYIIPLLIYNSYNKSNTSLHIIKNNNLEICNDDIKYELSHDVTGLLYDNDELIKNNNNIEINTCAILMTKFSWENIGFYSEYKNIIYKCVLNSFEQFILPLKCSNILLLNLSTIDDLIIEKPNLDNYISYNIKYSTPRKIFKGHRNNKNYKPPKIVQKNNDNLINNTSPTMTSKDNLKNIIKQKESLLLELHDLILQQSPNENNNYEMFEQYFNSI